jgi:hypothetical protein
MTIPDLARVLVRAADIAENDLHELRKDARLGTDGYSREEWAAYRLLRWLADAANEIEDEDIANLQAPHRTR